MLRIALLGALVAVAPLAAQGPAPAPAPVPAEPPPAAAALFRRLLPLLARIEVTASGAGAKGGVGTGFVVSTAGHLLTNFHVISPVVHQPAAFRATVTLGGEVRAARVIAVDVIQDLALLETGAPQPAALAFAPPPEQGTRLYALGHPRDLGLSIVEGTYNGLLADRIYPKVHFTGALNPGMSGGPAVTADGRVVGVNVATQGNEVSFLVPGARAAELVTRALAAPRPADSLAADVAAQLRAFDAEHFATLLAAPVATVQLGPFRAPTRPAPWFRCWGDAREPTPQAPVRQVQHSCSTEDDVFISETLQAGAVSLSHTLLGTDRVGALRFSAAYEQAFKADLPFDGTAEEATRFRCTTRNVRQATLVVRAQLCVRRYRRLPGLYEAAMRTATLGGGRTGLVSDLVLSGTTFPTIQRVTQRFIEALAAAPASAAP
ncbi:MAG: serine protease [Gemmatimonadales bacterium]|nr:serine protease [Gemmatimonadales bacterium]